MLDADAQPRAQSAGPAFEPHYSVPQIAKIWALHPDTVRSMFQNEDGVITIHHPERLRKRQHTTLRIPESVMVRVHRKWTSKSQQVQ